ncbi:MAG: hypothetical protein ACK4QW_03565, partial [Alphaproteobacteria bacterium]
MAGDLTELLRVARRALADMDARGLFAREPGGARLPVPTAVAAAFLHQDIRRHLGHLEALKWR